MRPQPGTFEYLETQMRREADGSTHGLMFERICKWFLENAPQYRGKFRRVYLWKEWPGAWGRDCGIDLVAETARGETWAVQAKAYLPDRSIPKAKLDSFLSESNRNRITHRLLIATTDLLSANARSVIGGQSKHISLVLRGDLLDPQLVWPHAVGGIVRRPPPARPQPHQAKAIRAVVNGFRKHDRGQLIMACGTGKTLTGLWSAHKLKSKSTLVLVPSLALVQQNLKEWGRHAPRDFDCLVVCSDETISATADESVTSAASLGIDPTTEPKAIRRFLCRKTSRDSVVFCTYQSSDRVAAAQHGLDHRFDLVICDEAHQLAGRVAPKWACALDARKICAVKRLFLTATPRFFANAVGNYQKQDASSVASMDDARVFGPVFHSLSFRDAINAAPPLLSDYQLVVIGVGSDYCARLVSENAALLTKSGSIVEARDVAAALALAKAMKKYRLRNAITFHNTTLRAKRFATEEDSLSLPAVCRLLSKASKPSGRMWAQSITGQTPTSRRLSILHELRRHTYRQVTVITNCACLREGIDVPALDAIAFIDPRKSIVDIIQAVGRVIRLSPDKKLGTVIVPVLLNESEDPEEVLEASVFRPVWQVIKALRAHDIRLAERLDSLRQLPQGARRAAPDLKPGIRFEAVHTKRLNIKALEAGFYVRTVTQATNPPPLTYDWILTHIDLFHKKYGRPPNAASGEIAGTSETWARVAAAMSARVRGLPNDSPSLSAFIKRERPGFFPSYAMVAEALRNYFTAHGRPPTTSTPFTAYPGWKTWASADNALRQRTLTPGAGSAGSLRQLIREVLPQWRQLDLAQILTWADMYFKRHEKPPRLNSGEISGTDDTWRTVDSALRMGTRGMPKVTPEAPGSLSLTLRRERPEWYGCLSISAILNAADEHFARTGRPPTTACGIVKRLSASKQHGQDRITWKVINNALASKSRGLPKDAPTSLATLLRAERPDWYGLTIEAILSSARRFYESHRRPPTATCGFDRELNRTWGAVNAALERKRLGLPLDCPNSLRELLLKSEPAWFPALTVEHILTWADEYYRRCGTPPMIQSGKIPGSARLWQAITGATRAKNASWQAVDRALRKSLCGLGPKGTKGLKALLQVERADWYEAPLSARHILKLADEHYRGHGRPPTNASGKIAGEERSWAAINSAIVNGLRGLSELPEAERTLSRFLRKKRPDWYIAGN